MAAFKILIASATCFDSAKLDWRVAKERIYTRSFFMEFIRILSPNSAPPVLRLEGSTETTAISLSVKSIKKRRTNSSTKEDLPEPPVPVIPNTGIDLASAMVLILFRISVFCSGKFSAAEITRAIAGTFLSANFSGSLVMFVPTGKSHF